MHSSCSRKMRREQEEVFVFGVRMVLLRLLFVLLVAAALLFAGIRMYSVPVALAAQKELSAHSKRPTQFHYVCPMHEDVTSKKQGLCPKCKMKLVKKPVPQPPAQ